MVHSPYAPCLHTPGACIYGTVYCGVGVDEVTDTALGAVGDSTHLLH